MKPSKHKAFYPQPTHTIQHRHINTQQAHAMILWSQDDPTSHTVSFLSYTKMYQPFGYDLQFDLHQNKQSFLLLCISFLNGQIKYRKSIRDIVYWLDSPHPRPQNSKYGKCETVLLMWVCLHILSSLYGVNILYLPCSCLLWPLIVW